jgi:RhtB (resistance to homoserine/threonine) family protein
MTFFGIDHYFAFLLSGIILNLTPGTDTIYILSRSISQGRNAGVASVLGIGTGTLIHTTCAAFGLSIILAKSAILFNVIKYLGVAYLIYLGIRMISQKESIFENRQLPNDFVSFRNIYCQGVLTNVLNPKVALFFISFLPQFIDTSIAHGPVPFLILGITFFITGTIWCLVLAFSASMITHQLRTHSAVSKIMQKCCGGLFIGLGLKLVLDRK